LAIPDLTSRYQQDNAITNRRNSTVSWLRPLPIIIARLRHVTSMGSKFT
jgi:hypothetical protein